MRVLLGELSGPRRPHCPIPAYTRAPVGWDGADRSFAGSIQSALRDGHAVPAMGELRDATDPRGEPYLRFLSRVRAAALVAARSMRLAPKPAGDQRVVVAGVVQGARGQRDRACDALGDDVEAPRRGRLDGCMTPHPGDQERADAAGCSSGTAWPASGTTCSSARGMAPASTRAFATGAIASHLHGVRASVRARGRVSHGGQSTPHATACHPVIHGGAP
jgi:hypothetical protein